MKELQINILSAEIIKLADALCFTANGVIKSSGSLVMGAGVAKAFAKRYTWLPSAAGKHVKESGNCVGTYWAAQDGTNIVSFPTKSHWHNASSITLIQQSAKELMELIEENKWRHTYLPRPGVGLGGLDWQYVKSKLESILDDRVTICYL